MVDPHRLRLMTGIPRRRKGFGAATHLGKEIDRLAKQTADLFLTRLLYFPDGVKLFDVRQQAVEQFPVAARLSLQFADHPFGARALRFRCLFQWCKPGLHQIPQLLVMAIAQCFQTQGTHRRRGGLRQPLDQPLQAARVQRL